MTRRRKKNRKLTPEQAAIQEAISKAQTCWDEMAFLLETITNDYNQHSRSQTDANRNTLFRNLKRLELERLNLTRLYGEPPAPDFSI